jgi:hypothetical protein
MERLCNFGRVLANTTVYNSHAIKLQPSQCIYMKRRRFLRMKKAKKLSLCVKYSYVNTEGLSRIARSASKSYFLFNIVGNLCFWPPT